MPDWKVNEPNIDLRLHDEPLAYQSSVGRVSFQIDYWQRDDRVPTNNVFTMGPGWECSWEAYIATDGNPDDSVMLYGANGGEIEFDDLTGATPDYYQNLRMLSLTDTNGNLTGYEMIYPSGAEDFYNFLATDTNGVAQQAYLSRKLDPQGHATTFIYSPFNPATGVVQLNYVIDPDGKTNTLSYTSNGTYNYLISQVQDPFGHTVHFAYDSNGFLTNVTDVAGISSSFSYGIFPGSDNWTHAWDGYEWYVDSVYNPTNYWLNQLTTPYGPTSFAFTDDSLADSDAVNRSVIITEANGSHQMFAHRAYTSFIGDIANPNGIPSSTPDGSGLDDGGLLVYRNSFYWGRQQFANLSANFLATGATNWDLTQLTTQDYIKARWQKWLHSDDGGQSDALSMEQDPSPDGINPGEMTWFTYPNQPLNEPFYQGSSSMPTLTIKVLPDGSQWYEQYQTDQWGNRTNVISTWTQPDGSIGTRTNSFVYAANGQDLLLVIGADGVTNAAYGYDSNHQVLLQTNALGEVTHYTYNANEQLTSTTLPNGLVTTNIYNTGGFQIQQIMIGVSTNSYTYINGLVYTHTDERALTVTNSWDALMRLTNVAYPDGTAIAYSYNDPHHPLDVVKVTDRMGFLTGYAYNSIRQKIAVTNALGNATFYNYCECGALESIVDALDNTTTFTHDNQGNLLQTAYPDGYTINNTYNLIHQLTTRTDSSGMSVTNWYNNQGLLIVSSNNAGQVAAYTYDIDDRITNRIDANNVSVGMSYDNLNRILTRSYPDGGVEYYGYSFGFSGPTSYTNQIGNPTLWSYDTMNRKTNEVLNIGVTTNRFAYSPASDLIKLTDGNGNATTWAYDIYGRVTNKVDAANNLLFVYKYDPDNRLTNRWSAAKGNTGYSYDNVGNLTQVTYPVSPAISLSYDALNRLTNMVDAVGTTVYGYDQVGQLLSEDGPFASDAVNYAYANRLRTGLSLQAPNASAWTQTYGYDSARRLTGISSPAGSFNYTYDTTQLQRVDLLTLPGGAYITNTYDSVARQTLTDLVNAQGTNLDSYAYGYNQANQRTNVVRTAGDFVNYTYDNMGELLSEVGREATGTFRQNERKAYVYDGAGNLFQKRFYPAGTSQANYTMNQLNQITNTTFSNPGYIAVSGSTTSRATNLLVNGGGAILYADNSFARLTPIVNGFNTFTAIAQDVYGRVSTNISTATINTNNSAYAYDLNGNLLTDGTRNFGYDDENQLIAVWQTSAWSNNFVYDGKMRRRIERDYSWTGSSWSETNEVHFIYDGNVVVQERNANNLPTITYTRGNDLSGTLQGAGGIGGLLARTDNSALELAAKFVLSGGSGPYVYYANGNAYYHADANGNVTMLISPSQMILAKYLYDPFGNMLARSGSLADANTYRFSSKEWNNNSGIYYYLYRYYDPNLQRWPNRDPIQEQGGYNIYIFVNQNPIDEYDLNGLDGTNNPPPNLPPLPTPTPKPPPWMPPYPLGPVNIYPVPPKVSCPIGGGWTGSVSGNPANGVVTATASGPTPIIGGTGTISAGTGIGSGLNISPNNNDGTKGWHIGFQNTWTF